MKIWLLILLLSSFFCYIVCVIFDKKSLPKDYVRDGLRQHEQKNTSLEKVFTGDWTLSSSNKFSNSVLKTESETEDKPFGDSDEDLKDLMDFTFTKIQENQQITKSGPASPSIFSTSSSFKSPKNQLFLRCEEFLRKRKGLKKISQSLRYHVDIDDHKQLDVSPVISKNDHQRCLILLEKIEKNFHDQIVGPRAHWMDKVSQPSKKIIERLSDVQLLKLVSMLNHALERRIRPSPELGKMAILGKPFIFSGIHRPPNQLLPKHQALLPLPLSDNRSFLLHQNIHPMSHKFNPLFSGHRPYLATFRRSVSFPSKDSHLAFEDSHQVREKMIDSHLGVKKIEKFNGDREVEIDGGPKTVVVHEGQLHVHPKGEVGHIEIEGNKVRKFGPQYMEESFPGFGGHFLHPNLIRKQFLTKTLSNQNDRMTINGLQDRYVPVGNEIMNHEEDEYQDEQNPIDHFSHQPDFNHGSEDGIRKKPFLIRNAQSLHSLHGQSYLASPIQSTTQRAKQCGPKGPNMEDDPDCPGHDGIATKYKAKTPIHKMAYTKYGSKYLGLRLSTIANYALGNLMGILYAPFMRGQDSGSFQKVTSGPNGIVTRDGTEQYHKNNEIEQEFEHLLGEDEEMDSE